VAELPEGYKPVPEEDRKKAKTFSDFARKSGETGNYDYAIEMYMQALGMDPDAVETHQLLRDLALKRKVSGGKDLGFVAKMKAKAPSKDDKQNMLTAERLLAFDPGNTDQMLAVFQNAYKAGFYDTVMWMGDILFKAIEDSGKPDFNKYIAMRDTYARLKRWKKSVDACQKAADIKPHDMDLQRELKNLGAQLTMTSGNYESGGSFRDSIKDMDGQRKLIDEDRNVTTEDVMGRIIGEAEAQYKADPNEPGKLMKLVDALVKTEASEHENRAVELLEEWFTRTKQFRFRMNIGQIRMKQLERADRAIKDELAANPTDADLKQRFVEFHRNRVEQELAEYQLWSENYPTEARYKFAVGRRLFELGKFDDAIPMFQQVRMDPKYRVEAGALLGRAFLDAGFVDEAVDTMRGITEEYQIRGDDKSKEIFYWYARSLEAHGDNPTSLKAYSQVAQWDFNYRDVQARIKKLRAAGK
jgi:tetratricopeptide (TPR) repeat protein